MSKLDYDKYTNQIILEYKKSILSEDIKDKIDDHPLIINRIIKIIFNFEQHINLRNEKFHLLALKSGQSTDNMSIYCFVYLDMNFQPKYICLAPSFVSMDGEFRRRFIPYPHIEFIMEHFGEIFSTMNDEIDKSHLKLMAEYIPYDDIQNDDLINYMEQSDLPNKLFNLTWIVQALQYYNGTIENHINPRYRENTMSKNYKQEFDRIIKQLSYNKILEMIFYASIIRTHPESLNTTSNLECGQKIIPLSVNAMREMGNLQYSIWKELYCNNAVKDLVINQVCAGISCVNEWFLIKITKGLFDNESMYNKLHQSNKVRETISQIQSENQNLTLHESLFRAFEDPFKIAEDNIILSDYAVCVVSEYVGRTLADLPNLIDSTRAKEAFGDIFRSKDMFHRYVFDIIYALYCCNSLLDMIHGDLHLNNCTIHRVYYSTDPLAHIYYNISGSEYLFPHKGSYGALIDFSRAILNPNSEHSSLDQFKEEVLRIYSVVFPEFFKEHKNDLEVVILLASQETFRIITAYDTYSVFSKFATLIENTKTQIAPANKALLTKIIKMTKDCLLNEMLSLVDKKIPLVDIEYPNLRLLSLFDDYLTTNYKPNCTILDLYHYGPLKYSLSHPDRYPPIYKNIKNIDLRDDIVTFQSTADTQKQYNKKLKQDKKVDEEYHNLSDELASELTKDKLDVPKQQLLFETSAQ